MLLFLLLGTFLLLSADKLGFLLLFRQHQQRDVKQGRKKTAIVRLGGRMKQKKNRELWSGQTAFGGAQS